MPCKSKKNSWVLLRAFHPKKFKKGIYTVSFRKKGKKLLDRNMKLFQVKSNSRRNAIRKARNKLKGR